MSEKLPYIKPIKLGNIEKGTSLYLLIPGDLAKTAGVDENSLFRLDVTITDNKVAFTYVLE